MATKLGGRVVMQCAAPFILPKTEWTITHSAHPFPTPLSRISVAFPTKAYSGNPA